MVQSNRVTIIVDDNAVYLDAGAYVNLELADCNIPEGVHALQFWMGKGEIEFKDNRQNLPITELPDWANACIDVWVEAQSNDPNYIHPDNDPDYVPYTPLQP